MIVAHSDGKSFYLNGSRVTIDELAALPSRSPLTSQPRLAVLVSCSTAKLSGDTPNGFLSTLFPQKKGLGELLVEKGFVDQVIAPDHEIDQTESLQLLESLKDNVTIRSILQGGFSGWHKLATVIRNMLFRNI